MRRKSYVIVFAILALLHAQEALNNDAVIKMVRSGLSEEIIVSMVRTQPAKFLMTPEQLIALKAAGVSDKIVASMVERSSGTGLYGSPASSGATPMSGAIAGGDPNDPMTSHDSGIYLYAKNRNGEYKLTVLEQAAYQGSKTGGMLGTALTYGIKKAKMKAVIPGQKASIATPDSQPVFYFYFEEKAAGLGGFGGGAVSNPNQFALVKLAVTKSSRETVIGEFSAFSSSTGTNEKSMVTFKSDRVRPGLYKVVPNGPLDPGEYCFLASQSNQIFDFAVNPNQ